MAGLIDLVGRGTIPADATVLYAHLGGPPALNAYSALFSSRRVARRARRNSRTSAAGDGVRGVPGAHSLPAMTSCWRREDAAPRASGRRPESSGD